MTEKESSKDLWLLARADYLGRLVRQCFAKCVTKPGAMLTRSEEVSSRSGHPWVLCVSKAFAASLRRAYGGNRHVHAHAHACRCRSRFPCVYASIVSLTSPFLTP